MPAPVSAQRAFCTAALMGVPEPDVRKHPRCQSGAAQTPSKINVFVVKAIALVHPAHTLKIHPAHEQECAEDPVGPKWLVAVSLRHHCPPVPGRLPRPAVSAQTTSNWNRGRRKSPEALLRRAVFPNELAPQEADLRVIAQEAQCIGKPPAEMLSVGVQEQDIMACCRCGSTIDVRGESKGDRILDDANLGVRKYRRSMPSRQIVDNQDFRDGAVNRPVERCDTAREHSLMPVTDNDDRNVWKLAHADGPARASSQIALSSAECTSRE